MRWLPPAVAAALGLYQLGEPSLWIDEAFTWRAVSAEAPPLADELHALYYLGMRPWTELAGTSEFALRLPSVIGAVLAVSLLYGFAQRLFDERVALISALLLAINPYMVQWSQQARSYTFLVCLAIGSTWLLVRAMGRGDRVAWIEYGLAAGAMIVVQWLSAGLLLAAHLAVARSRSAFVTLAAVGVVVSPWMAKVLTRSEADGLQPTSWIEQPTLAQVGSIALDVPGAFGVGLLLAIIGAALTERYRWLLVCWAFGPFVLALAASAMEPVLVERYLIVSSPAFAVLGAVTLVTLARRVRVVAVGTTAAATLAALVLWYWPSGGDNWRGENWREAVAFVEGRALVEPDWALPAFRYYGGIEAQSGWLLYRVEDPNPAGSPERSFGKRLHLRRVAKH